ncbi:apoptosis regulator BAX-like [Amphiura filiformis]|uniref:apoptosis regulator BAX-like n=1 Tax=Amphiura filiformis TaxID=82378 RepID=UPI003B221E36
MPIIQTSLIVARVVFGDMKDLNWGRIVEVFFFASEMCIQTAKRGILTGSDLREFVLEFTLFIKEHFGKWIAMHGGWKAILTYFSSPTVFVSVLAISAIAMYVIYKLNQ